MDPISLIAVVSSILTALFSADKLKEYIKFDRKKDDYESTLKLYRKFIELHMGVESPREEKNKEGVVKRVFIGDEEIKDRNKLLSAYKEININISDIEGVDKKITEYHLYIDYLHHNLEVKDVKGLGLAVNSGLIGSLIKNYVSSTDRSAINRSTVVGMLVGNKIKQDTKSYTYLSSALALHVSAVFLGGVELNTGVLALLFTMISGLMINQKVLEYRIKKGLYGTSPYEVREILKYIEEHSDPDDFNDEGGRKKIFQDAVEDAPKEVIVYGGAYR